MYEITSITSNSKQRMEIPIEGGATLDFYLYYLPTQYSWYFDFTYENYSVHGEKVVLSPNTIRHLRNILPFGISFLADGDIEPYSLTDFSSGRVQMFILNEQDIQEVEELIYG